MTDISLYDIGNDIGEDDNNPGLKEQADRQLKNIYELTRLYDTYGPLLSDHNRVIFEDYVLNNYSLGEIASDQEISRQGVRDVVLRCSRKLRGFEEKLGMLARLDEAVAMMEQLEEYIEGSEGIVLADRIRKLLEG